MRLTQIPLVVCMLLGGVAAHAQEMPTHVPAAEPPGEGAKLQPEEPPYGTEPGAGEATAAPAAAVSTGPMLDGHPREGAFLAGPGSLSFILHHSLLGAAGGLAFTGIPSGFNLEQDSRTAMLIGTLVGAGVGFGVSSWYQFNNWLDAPAANFAIINSLVAGMFMTGMVDLFSDDALTMATAGFIGAELGAWLTVTLGTGELPMNQGLMMASGAGWGLAYGALLMATLATSGNQLKRSSDLIPPLLIAPGLGAGVMALAAMRYSPTSTQVLRADAFGAAVGGGVLLLSALVTGGFNQPTPYILGGLSSMAAMAVVSLLWEEAAERPEAIVSSGRRTKGRPYTNIWW